MPFKLFSAANDDALAAGEHRFPKHEFRRVQGWMQASRERLDGAASAGPVGLAHAHDRREQPRERLAGSGVVASIRVLAVSGFGRHLAGRLRDVSMEGISLLLEEPLEADTGVSVALAPVHEHAGRRARRDKPVFLRCTVLWGRPDYKSGGFVVGCRLGVEWADSLGDLVAAREDLGRRAA